MSEERAGGEYASPRSPEFYSELRSYTLKLTTPIEVNGKTYTEFKIREPIADDLWHIPDEGKKVWGDWFSLAAKLANVEIFVIRKLRAHDAYKLRTIVAAFFIGGDLPVDLN